MSCLAIRIRERARSHLVAVAPGAQRQEGDFDCRLLYMGADYRKAIRAFEEIVHLYESGLSGPRLAAALEAADAVSELYEVDWHDGIVGVRLRDSVFHGRGGAHAGQLDLRLRVWLENRTLERVVPIEHLGAVGALWPRILGDHGEAEVETGLREACGPDDARWALDLVRTLWNEQLLERTPRVPGAWPKPGRRPRVTLLGHSSLLVESERSAILTDPLIRSDLGLPHHVFHLPRMRLGAICCSHSHWDHCNPQTLLRFDKRIPVVIPRIRRASVFNPPIGPMLRLLGFRDIREVDPWESVQVDDLEITAVPFHGEQDEPDAEVDHYTYVIRTPGLTVYGGVDAFRDTFGDMRPVLARVQREFRPDVAFLPVSRMVYHYRFGGVNAFCRYFDATLLDKSFQYTASARDAAEWAAVLDPKLAVPYATFTFSRRAPSVAAVEFQRCLLKLGLGQRFFPLRPFDALDWADATGSRWGRLRRVRELAYFGASGRVRVTDRRLLHSPRYRWIRRMVVRGAARTVAAVRELMGRAAAPARPTVSH